MKQYDVQAVFEVKVSKNGAISKSMMRKMTEFLMTQKKLGEYFVKDSTGNTTMWSIERKTDGEVVVECEITSDELDRYSVYKSGRKLDHEFAEHESYDVA